MSTIIYPSPIFGPVRSRRLGISLGINLMPDDGKICTFDCIYCECGLNKDFRPTHHRPSLLEVTNALRLKLIEMKAAGELPDVLTFAGNGEPTAHPDFPDIIDNVIALRDEYCPAAKVSVLTNSTMAFKGSVRKALMKVDNNIMKLDTINEEFIKMVDRPIGHYDVQEIIDTMKSFDGHLIIQTMFLKGEVDGHRVDNTTDEYVLPWLEAVKEISPQCVMIYTLDRETPVKGLMKATHQELDAIRDRVVAMGVPCSASY